MKKEKIVNVPNAVSLLRLLLVLPAMLLLHYDRTMLAFIVYLILISSDALDGFLARKLNQVTDFGEYLDFVVDFVYYYTFIIYFIITGNIIMLNSVLLIIATAALLWIAITLSKKAGRLYMPHFTSAKVLAVILVVSIGAFMLGWDYSNALFFSGMMVIFAYTVPDYIRYARSYVPPGRAGSEAGFGAPKRKKR